MTLTSVKVVYSLKEPSGCVYPPWWPFAALRQDEFDVGI